MIDREIREYVRIMNSLSLNQASKNRITECLVKNADKREISGKYVAAASAVAFLAVSTFLIARGMREDINIM